MLGDSAGGAIYDRYGVFPEFITFEVPEPGTMALMALGLLTLLGIRRKR